jgi:protein SERAC1
VSSLDSIRHNLADYSLFSIIAIHGLDGHPQKSWTAPNGTLWLRDLLPEKLPQARILTYGYDAYTRGREQLADESVYALAQKLLADLATERHDSDVSPEWRRRGTLILI